MIDTRVPNARDRGHESVPANIGVEIEAGIKAGTGGTEGDPLDLWERATCVATSSRRRLLH